MSPDEVVRLIAVARAAYPGMSVVEGMPQVWHGALGDLQYGECASAVVAHSRESTQIVTVADIRRLVQSTRRSLAGEERQQQIEAARPAPSSRDLVPMPPWFRSTVEEHRRRARAARKQAEEKGEPVTFGSAIVSALDGMPKNNPRQWS